MSSDRSGKPETCGFWKCRGEMGLWSVFTRLFFIFCQIFAIIWWFFKVKCPEVSAKLWKIINYTKNLANNEEKPCSTCLKAHFRLISGTLSVTIVLYVFSLAYPFVFRLIRIFFLHFWKNPKTLSNCRPSFNVFSSV